MKILVVDDDMTALALIEAALAQYGFTNVTTATSAFDAMQVINSAKRTFDCFLLDYRMPEVEGTDLCAQIRKFRQYKTTPVIFVTAKSDRASVNTAYAVGAVDYVSKPIDPQEIGIRVSIAERMALEEREKVRNRSEGFGSGFPQRMPQFAFEDPVPLFNVTGVITRMALDNYLKGAAPDERGDFAVSAIAINEFEDVYTKASPTYAYAFLTEISKVISKSLQRSDTLISYNGYGEFIGVTKDVDLSANHGHARLINSRIARLNLKYEDGTPCTATVTIGQPAQTPVWNAADPAELIEQALLAAGSTEHSFRSSAVPGQSSDSCSSPFLNM